MITVYADTVFLVNFFADYTLLYLCGSFLHIKVSWKKLMYASLFGAFYALGSIVIRCVGHFSFAALAAMCFIAFGKRSIISFIKILTAVFSFSLVLAGVAELLSNNFRNVSSYNIVFVLMSVFVLYLIVSASCRIFYVDLSVKSVRVNIIKNNKAINVNLMSDSGNLLREPISNTPVIILDSRYKSSFESAHEQPVFLKIKTVGNEGRLELYIPDAVLINGKDTVAFVGFTSDSASSFDGYDGIIPGVLIQNIF